MKPTNERPLFAAAIGAAIGAAITLPGLGVGTLWDNSETAYGEVAREVLLTGNWLVMHFNGVPYFVQPPLYFWLAAAFAHAFGLSAFSLRLPSALATIALGGLTGYAVARQAGTRAGIYASAILSSSLMQAVIGRLAIMDALLNLAVATTIFWWFRGLQTGRDRYFVYGALAAALGMLAKGLVCPVVALLVVVPYAWWNGRHEPVHWPSWRGWALGGLAFAAIALPWPIALSQAFGGRSFPLDQLIGRYTFGRYVGVIENQSGPIWYYLPVIILGFFPWIAFLPAAIAGGVARLRDPQIGSAGALLRLAFVWAVVPLAFFSLARTKLPNYVALEFPAIALIVALYFERLMESRYVRGAIVSAFLVPLAIGALAIAIGAFATNNRLGDAAADLVPGLIVPGAAIFAGSLLTALLLTRRSTMPAAPYALTLATVLAVSTATTIALPRAEAYKPIPRMAALIESHRHPGDVVGIQDISGGNALLFYSRPPIAVLARDSGSRIAPAEGLDPHRFVCGARRAWVVVRRGDAGRDGSFGRNRHVLAFDRNAALLLYDGPACSF